MGVSDIFSTWLADLQEAGTGGRSVRFDTLFTPGAVWRDLLVLDWDFRNHVGIADIQSAVRDGFARRRFDGFVVDAPTTAYNTNPDAASLTGFFLFTTAIGKARGCAELHRGDDGTWRAVAVVVQLEEIAGHPERIGAHRPIGRTMGPVIGRIGWAQERARELAFEEEPAVVIIGGGQTGLMLAARLKMLGVSHLIVERNPRIGDNWRNRYPSLALHDPYAVDHLPYLPFPSSWPRFTPKDKFADFLESYATLLDLNVWTGASVGDVAYERDAGAWSIQVTRADGSVQTLRPRHLAVATGANDHFNIPDVPGKDLFKGTALHANRYRDPAAWAGKKAVIVGSGVTGHDVAQDLCEQGVDVTLVQKSSTYVVDAPYFHRSAFGNYENAALGTEDTDLIGALRPFGMLAPTGGKILTDLCAAHDAAPHDRLRERGFALDFGPDGTGVVGIVYKTGRHGYYYNVGASDLIAEGQIQVAQGATVERLTETGVVLTDGRELPADLLVWATGYRPASEALRGLIGNAADGIAEPLKPGADLELTSVWRPCGHDGLWLMHAYGIQQGRFYSKLAALQILAEELGLRSDATKADDEPELEDA